RTGQNVSHAAKALGVNRSTLQNKILRLDVNERFHRRVEGPVRRIRKKGDETLPVIPDAKAFVFDREEEPPAKKSATGRKERREEERDRPGKPAENPSRQTSGKKDVTKPAKKAPPKTAKGVVKKAAKKGAKASD
ncbi:MAG: hypothetical protein CVV45_10765, partial [Spirochaetae bacterium HGW-Spirochaetae-10]